MLSKGASNPRNFVPPAPFFAAAAPLCSEHALPRPRLALPFGAPSLPRPQFMPLSAVLPQLPFTSFFASLPRPQFTSFSVSLPRLPFKPSFSLPPQPYTISSASDPAALPQPYTPPPCLIPPSWRRSLPTASDARMAAPKAPITLLYFGTMTSQPIASSNARRIV